MDRVDAIVIGAGVVGIAIARELALRGREVLILEAESAIGTVTTARNSGVIHAGIYYKPDSIKAKVCVDGRNRLYAYTEKHGIPHRRCGKLIVATAPDQLEKLEYWKGVGEQNGVTGLRFMTPAEVKEMEPEVYCIAAVHSPDTGIIDVHSYLLAMLGEAEGAGATLVLKAPVLRGEVISDGFALEVGGDTPMRIGCRTLVNAAGLGAQDFAGKLEGLDPAVIPPLLLGKGNYFSMTGKPPFKMLIYPLPGIGSLGLHATCDVSGRIRFGPDIEWVDRVDYTVDPSREPMFEEAIRHYWPNLPKGILQPDYCGVRPKIAKASPYDTDFVVQGPEVHKLPGLINLFGIESPGITSSLALAELVADRL